MLFQNQEEAFRYFLQYFHQFDRCMHGARKLHAHNMLKIMPHTHVSCLEKCHLCFRISRAHHMTAGDRTKPPADHRISGRTDSDTIVLSEKARLNPTVNPFQVWSRVIPSHVNNKSRIFHLSQVIYSSWSPLCSLYVRCLHHIPSSSEWG